ncbi:MAG: hypothetical protein IKM61_03135 [Eubacteriaceae bacterium]|nr:hypothetical protein [Eubacteriaceae bacterium]
MTDKITEYIKRELCGGKKATGKILGVYPEHILCAVEEEYLGYPGLYTYLEGITGNYDVDYVVISTHLPDGLESELMGYFAKHIISVRTSSEFDEKNKIAMIICQNDIDRSDVMFRIDVPMEVYKLMKKKVCSDCHEKIAKDYPMAAYTMKKIGFFSSEKCPMCGK